MSKFRHVNDRLPTPLTAAICRRLAFRFRLLCSAYVTARRVQGLYCEIAVRLAMTILVLVPVSADAGQDPSAWSIVELQMSSQRPVLQASGAPAPTSETPAQQASYLADLQARKRALREVSRRRGIQLQDHYSHLPLMLAPAHLAEALASMPGVRAVYANQQRYLHLNESTLEINRDLLPSLFPDLAGRARLSGKGTAVVIADTGVDVSNRALGACTAPGPRCKVVAAVDATAGPISLRQRRPRNDASRAQNDHGTNVAAIAAGLYGVASSALIVDARVMDAQGRIFDTYVIQAINWAIVHRNRYNLASINLSLGGGKPNPGQCVNSVYGTAVSRARVAGVVVVASSGNDGLPGGMGEPACVPGVLSVGAVYDGGPVTTAVCPGPPQQGAVACFSNASLATRILAPGVEIVAGGIALSGTSQAAPHVSGAVAILHGLDPLLTPGQIEDRITRTGRSTLDPRNGQRYPRLDLAGLIGGQLNTLTPQPEQDEWWWTGQFKSRQLPVLTDPWWEPSGNRTMIDWATDLRWRIPSTLADQQPMSIRNAQNLCWRSAHLGRLPTRQEIASILEIKRPGLAVDIKALPGATADFYWTATPAGTDGHWAVHLSDGRWVKKGTSLDGGEARALCLTNSRPLSPKAHYLDQGSTVEDTATGLVWQKDSVQAPDFQSLADACLKSGLAQRSWRVPSFKEISTLFKANLAEPYLDPLFQGDRLLVSSSLSAPFAGQSFAGIDFERGFLVDSGPWQTRCVSQQALRSDAITRMYKGNLEILGDQELGNQRMQAFEAAHYATVRGNVLIEGLQTAAVVWPYLERIEGDLVIVGTNVEAVHLPQLREVTGTVSISDNVLLERLRLPQLAKVGGSLALVENPRLGTVSEPSQPAPPLVLQALKSVGKNLDLLRNRQVEAAVFPSLNDVGGRLQIEGNDRLLWFQARSLISLGKSCPSAGDFCGTLSVQLNSELQSVSLDFLREIAADLNVQGNRKLVVLATTLEQVGAGIAAQMNPQFCESSQIDPILARMWRKGRVPTSLALSGNEPSPGCRTLCPDLANSNCPILQ